MNQKVKNTFAVVYIGLILLTLYGLYGAYWHFQTWKTFDWVVILVNTVLVYFLLKRDTSSEKK